MNPDPTDARQPDSADSLPLGPAVSRPGRFPSPAEDEAAIIPPFSPMTAHAYGASESPPPRSGAGEAGVPQDASADADASETGAPDVPETVDAQVESTQPGPNWLQAIDWGDDEASRTAPAFEAAPAAEEAAPAEAAATEEEIAAPTADEAATVEPYREVAGSPGGDLPRWMAWIEEEPPALDEADGFDAAQQVEDLPIQEVTTLLDTSADEPPFGASVALDADADEAVEPAPDPFPVVEPFQAADRAEFAVMHEAVAEPETGEMIEEAAGLEPEPVAEPEPIAELEPTADYHVWADDRPLADDEPPAGAEDAVLRESQYAPGSETPASYETASPSVDEAAADTGFEPLPGLDAVIEIGATEAGYGWPSEPGEAPEAEAEAEPESEPETAAEPPAAAATPPAAGGLEEVADRLERIARSLRESSLEELLARSRTGDPLELLLAGIVIGRATRWDASAGGPTSEP